MLYKFKSKATGDVIMLEAQGRRLLEIIGKTPGPTGIVLPEQMSAALSALEQAIAEDEARQQAEELAARTEGQAPPRREGVSLRQRAVPFMDMLRRAAQTEHEITWGV